MFLAEHIIMPFRNLCREEEDLVCWSSKFESRIARLREKLPFSLRVPHSFTEVKGLEILHASITKAKAQLARLNRTTTFSHFLWSTSNPPWRRRQPSTSANPDPHPSTRSSTAWIDTIPRPRLSSKITSHSNARTRRLTAMQTLRS